jgi:hypothetical protein
MVSCCSKAHKGAKRGGVIPGRGSPRPLRHLTRNLTLNQRVQGVVVAPSLLEAKVGNAAQTQSGALWALELGPFRTCLRSCEWVAKAAVRPRIRRLTSCPKLADALHLACPHGSKLGPCVQVDEILRPLVRIGRYQYALS